jgi:hypothetical protein
MDEPTGKQLQKYGSPACSGPEILRRGPAIKRLMVTPKSYALSDTHVGNLMAVMDARYG